VDAGAARQVLVEKQQLDCFTESKFSRAVWVTFRAGRYVVYGVVTEYCVRSARRSDC
jgi:hypothetical protein